MAAPTLAAPTFKGLRFSTDIELDHAGKPTKQTVTFAAKADKNAKISDCQMEHAPGAEKAKTVLYVDFVASPECTEALPLNKSMNEVVQNLFNHEAEKFITWSAELKPANGAPRPDLYRLALFFRENFFTTITERDAWVANLLLFAGSVELTNTLEALDPACDGDGHATLVKGGQIAVEIDRKVLSSEALETMPEAIRAKVEAGLNTMPAEVSDKVRSGTESMPLSLFNFGTKINADAKTVVNLERVADLVRGAANAAGVVVPKAVRPLLLGVRSIHMRAEGSAMIDINLGGTVPLLQLLPVEGEVTVSEEDAEANKKQALALYEAAAKNDINKVSELLASSCLCDGHRDALGRTALHRASRNGYSDVVCTLVEKKSSLEATDCDGSTALMTAAECNKEDVVQALLEAKADVTAKDDMGCTAAQIAEEEGHSKLAQLLATQAPSKNEALDRNLNINLAVKLDHKDSAAEQTMIVDIQAPSTGKVPQPLKEQAEALGLHKCPADCKSMVIAKFLTACKGGVPISPSDIGQLQGIFDMAIEAGLTQEWFNTHETVTNQAENGQMYFVLALYFNKDWHAEAVDTQAVVRTVKQIQARLELTKPLAALLETFESTGGEDDPALPKYLKCLKAQLKVDESLLSSEMLSTLPKKLPDWLLVKLDTEMVPLQEASTDVNIDFDADLLFSVMQEQLGIASVSMVVEQAKGIAKVPLDPTLKTMIDGLAGAQIISGNGAMVDLDFGGALPIFKILPCQEEEQDDDDDDWE